MGSSSQPKLLEMGLNVQQNLSDPQPQRLRHPQQMALCRMLSDRTFALQGRADRVIKVEEKRISLPEIELHLKALEWIGEAVVFPGELNNRRMLCAVITLTHAGQNKFNEMGPGRFWIMLRTALRNSVEPVGIPRRYRVVELISVDPQGKYSLTKIEKMFKENA